MTPQWKIPIYVINVIFAYFQEFENAQQRARLWQHNKFSVTVFWLLNTR